MASPRDRPAVTLVPQPDLVRRKERRFPMSMKFLGHFNTRRTPQSEPIPGSAMVPDSAGGHAFAVDDWTRLERFLILGSEGGSYYATERALTVENAQAVVRC